MGALAIYSFGLAKGFLFSAQSTAFFAGKGGLCLSGTAHGLGLETVTAAGFTGIKRQSLFFAPCLAGFFLFGLFFTNPVLFLAHILVPFTE